MNQGGSGSDFKRPRLNDANDGARQGFAQAPPQQLAQPCPGMLRLQVVDSQGHGLPAQAWIGGQAAPGFTWFYGVAKAPGPYQVTVQSAGYLQQSGWFQVQSRQQTNADFVLLRPGSLTVDVQDGSGQALANATVTIQLGQEPEQSGPTGGDGRATFPDLFPGDYGIKASADGFINNSNAASVAEGRRTDATVTLRQGIFIVGEGERFDYAIGLTRSHADRVVLASQYDWTQPPGGLPANLLVHRHAAVQHGQPDFDATDPRCWQQLGDAYGKFWALVFNNPHAGNGLPKVQVYGVGRSISPWHYQSFSAATITDFGPEPPQDYTADQLFEPKCGGCMTPIQVHAAVQPGNSIPCGNCGRNLVAPQPGRCPTCSRALDDGVLACGGCPTYFLYYSPLRRTMGLNPHLLRCYLRHGGALLQRGGTIVVNGPDWIGNYLNDADWRRVNLGWPAPGVATFLGSDLFADYRPNLTHPQPHPSWGPSSTSAANPRNMKRYSWRKN